MTAKYRDRMINRETRQIHERATSPLRFLGLIPPVSAFRVFRSSHAALSLGPEE